jgi:hypothetical protein
VTRCQRFFACFGHIDEWHLLPGKAFRHSAFHLVPWLSQPRGEEHPQTLMAMHNLAIALEDAGRWREAAELFEKEFKAAILKLGPTHRTTIDVMNHLAYAY